MSDRKQKAVELFNQGYNCAQAIFTAYGDVVGIDKETGMKLTSGFGGGISRLGETCGAINSAVMIIGLKYGNIDARDVEQKKEATNRIRELIKKFKENHKSIYCRDLLTEDNEITYKMHSSKCSNIVEEICELLNQYI